MPQQLYSVEQVADLLGLHVKTVRGYVRDGRLKAVRIGKQYRIAHQDLEALTGHTVCAPARETAPRTRHVEVSSIVQIDAIDPDSTRRLATTLLAAANRPTDDGGRLRVETVYDEERGSLKIILIGDVSATANLLTIIEAVLESQP